MRTIILGLIFGCVFGCLNAQAADGIPSWRILPEKSSIGFTAQYGAQTINGEFPSYSADIRFDPSHLDQSKVVVRIEMAKMKSGDKDAQENLPAADWFDASHFPLATFESSSFEAIAMATTTTNIPAKNYLAKGRLTIRGKSIPVTFPFTLETFKGDGADTGKTFARMNAAVSLKRLDFGVGQGQWADTGTIKNDVSVQVKLEAVTP